MKGLLEEVQKQIQEVTSHRITAKGRVKSGDLHGDLMGGHEQQEEEMKTCDVCSAHEFFFFFVVIRWIGRN